MHTHPLFLTGFLLLVLLGVVHTAATVFFWYWIFPWLDIAVHFLGGMIVAFYSLWFLLRLLGSFSPSWRIRTYGLVFAVVIVVGTIWELFELYVGIPRGANFAFDTTLDMLMNVSGALVATYLSHKFFV